MVGFAFLVEIQLVSIVQGMPNRSRAVIESIDASTPFGSEDIWSNLAWIWPEKKTTMKEDSLEIEVVDWTHSYDNWSNWIYCWWLVTVCVSLFCQTTVNICACWPLDHIESSLNTWLMSQHHVHIPCLSPDSYVGSWMGMVVELQRRRLWSQWPQFKTMFQHLSAQLAF